MRELLMRDIYLPTLHGRTRIPGGWRIQVPEVEPVASDMVLLRRALMDDFGGDASKAERKARADIGIEYVQARIRNVRLSVRYFAIQYAKMWPKHVSVESDRHGPVATLRGFDPEQAAQLYWPNSNDGRRGKEFSKSFLREMGRGMKR